MSNSEVIPDLKEGPLKTRMCTDVIFAILFIIFTLSMIIVGIFGVSQGDPSLLLYPFDSSGNQCGLSSASSYKFLYFVNITESLKYTVCVESCPLSDHSNISCYLNTYVSDCSLGQISFTPQNSTLTSVPVYASDNFMNRFCIPQNEIDNDIITTEIQNAHFIEFGSDLTRTWKLVILVMAIAIGMSVIYLFTLRYFLTCAIWATFVLIITTFIVFGYFLQTVAQNDYNQQGHETTKIVLWVLAILFYVLALFFLILTVCIKEKIDLTVAVMKSAVLFIGDVWTSLLVPFTVLLIGVGILTGWLFALIYLFTSGEKQDLSIYPPIGAVAWNETLKILFWFELLGIFWINAFKIASTQYIIAYATGTWYYTHRSAEGLVQPVWKGVKTLFSFHIGSVAFGSFIIGATLILKFFLVVLATSAKRGKNNPVTKILCLCCACCIGCIEKFVSFLDDGIYIRIALTGENFCKAAKNSFELILQNAGRFSVLGGVSSFFSLVGQLLISFLAAYVGFMILKGSDVFGNLQSPVPTIIAFWIVSYVISGIFLSVYEISCDTIIQSYIIDEKNSKGIDLQAPGPMLDFMRDYKEDPDKGCF